MPILTMTRLALRFARLATVASLLPIVVACSEDEPSTGIEQTEPRPPTMTEGVNDGVTPPPRQTQDAGSSANGSLTGRLITSGDFPHRNALLSFDFETARYSVLEGADVASSIRSIDNDDTVRFFSADHSEPGRFVETQYQCQGEIGVRCIGLWGANGVLESAFSVSEPDIVVPGTSLAKRSRDGRFVAFTHREGEFLEIRNSAGDLVSSGRYERRLLSPYDWLPDGSILIENDIDGDPFDGIIRLVRTEPYAAKGATTITLPERYSGRIRNLVVDPSGTRVAMLVRLSSDDSNNRIPIVLDLSNNAIHEPVASGGGATGLDAVGIHWSPDGQFLIFQNPRFRPILTPLPDAPASGQGLPENVTYVVRADGGSYPLPASVAESNDDARIIVARPSNDPDGAPAPGNADPGYVWVQ